jgi:hypothetical protein
MNTIPEQITNFENTRAAKAARMTDLMTKAADAGVTLDAAQSRGIRHAEARSRQRRRAPEAAARTREIEIAGATPITAKANEPADATSAAAQPRDHRQGERRRRARPSRGS